MPPSGSPIKHPLAKSSDAIQTAQIKQVSLCFAFPAESAGSTKGNFFPIVVFYPLGALIERYAPIGHNVSLLS